MQNKSNAKIKRMVGMAIFIAIIVVLQVVATYIKFGSFSITLAMVPIVVGAAMYGPMSGVIFGGAFGIVVLIGCISGVDGGGAWLWSINPALTGILCLVKGMAAGLAAGLIYSAVSKKNIDVGVICAAIICPIVNTGIFIAAMIFLFKDTLNEWATLNEYSNPLYYAFMGIAGINFLLEFGLNVILSPGVARIIKIAKKSF